MTISKLLEEEFKILKQIAEKYGGTSEKYKER